MLVFIGGVFLLQNLGVLPPSVWGSLWRLWPVVLILAGLEILFGQRMPWLVGIVGLAAVIAALGVAAGLSGGPGARATSIVNRTFETDLGTARQAALTVRFGAGQLTLDALSEPPPGRLAEMTFEGPGELVPAPTFTTIGEVARLDYQVNQRGGPAAFPFLTGNGQSPRMQVRVAPQVPITSLVVQTGAADARIDLSRLRVASLDMAVGAATTWLRLPESGATTAHISGGAATIRLEVPPGVAAQIRHRGGLSAFNIDESRFPPAGNELHRSPDYDTNPNRVDVSIETGVTTIQVN
ncbi:MAG: cell wall-active antibiotics response protein [Chloroflexota bacterium]|nr:cell wall-active antibiotics response protein [Chloroflexota bacterium]